MTEHAQKETALQAVGHRGLTLSTIQDISRAADMLIQAGLVQNRPKDKAEAIVRIQAGLELGIGWTQAVRWIAVFNGHACVFGDLGIALGRSSGLLEDCAEQLEGEGDDLTATCSLRRVGQVTPIVGEFSVADAKKAGLWGKSGPWTNYPRRMLMWRARSWAYRDGFADVLAGLPFREEAMDLPPEHGGGGGGGPREVAIEPLSGGGGGLLPPREGEAVAENFPAAEDAPASAETPQDLDTSEDVPGLRDERESGADLF